MRLRNVLFAFLAIVLLLIPSINFAQIDTQPQIDSLSQLFDKAKKLEDKKVLLKSLSNLYEEKGDWGKYEEIVKQMLLLQEEKKDLFYLAETYNKLGISNSCMGKNQQALNYFGKALEINIAQNDTITSANSYENMAAACKDLGDYPRAVEYLIKSLEIRKKINHPRVFNNYMKLAVLQQLLENPSKQDFYLDLARQEIQKQKDFSATGKAIFYNELGNVFRTRKMYDSCYVCYKKVIFYSEQVGWNRGIAEGLGNLADVYSEIGVIDSAIIYHQKSLKLSERIVDCIGASHENLYLAKLYQKINKNDSVLIFAKEALRKAEACALLREQSMALKFISEYYNKRHNFEQAFNYLQRHYTLKDSISSAEIKSNISEIETKYQTKVKEQQINLLTAENEIKNQRMQQAFLFIGLLILLVALLLALYYFRRNQARYKQGELQQQLLRSQMNPHFIFNVMGSIQGYLYKNEASKAADYLSKFAALSRSVLNFSSQEKISLKEEIEMLQNYIELERARMEKPFDIEYKIDDDLETDFIEIPPMLLQPFVENAIKHGLQNLSYQGKLSLCFKEKNGFVAVEILDNGTGLSKQNDKGHQSKALKIFKQRKKGIEHRYKKDLIFEFQNLKTIDENKHGIRVYLQLPILNND